MNDKENNLNSNNNLKSSKILITGIYYYPLKGGKEVQVNEAYLTERGIENDRIFAILYKKNLEWINIRKNMKIYYIEAAINDNVLTLKIPDVKDIFSINYKEAAEIKMKDEKNIVNVKIYDITGKGVILDEKINKILSDYFGAEVLLTYSIIEREMKQSSDKLKLFENFNEKDKTFFADLAPYLITSEESLNFLNQKLQEKGESSVKNINFRPNIVISGGKEAFFEDKIQKMKTNDIVFRRIKGCVRCKVTTLEIEKKQFNKNQEPLNTLYDYTNDEKLGGCVFGQNFSCDVSNNNGRSKIKVGDELTLID
jgi:uncharacterized protein YcbX